MTRTWFDNLAFVVLWCFVFSVPFETTVMVSTSTVSRLIGAVLLPVAILALVARGWVLPFHWAHWWTVAFTGWTAVSYLWTVWPSDTYDRVLTQFQLLIVVSLVWQLCTGQNSARNLTKAYLWGTLVSCGGTFLRYAAHEQDATKFGRYAVKGFDPNDLGLTLALSVPLSYYFFLRNRGWAGTGWLLQIGAASVTCLLTASRMGAVTLLVSLLIVPLTLSELDKRQRCALAAGFAIAVLACAACVPPSSWERLSTISTEVKTLNSRTEIWASGLESFKTTPLVGVGAGAFQDAVEPLLSFYDDRHAFVAHNTFLSVLTELGVVGMVLFLAICGSVIAAAVQIAPPLLRKAWLLTVVVWAVGVFTLTWEPRKPTWIIFALIIQTRAASESQQRPDGRHRDYESDLDYLARRLAVASCRKGSALCDDWIG